MTQPFEADLVLQVLKFEMYLQEHLHLVVVAAAWAIIVNRLHHHLEELVIQEMPHCAIFSACFKVLLYEVKDLGEKRVQSCKHPRFSVILKNQDGVNDVVHDMCQLGGISLTLAGQIGRKFFKIKRKYLGQEEGVQLRENCFLVLKVISQ